VPDSPASVISYHSGRATEGIAMSMIFDRYLMRRFLHVYFILFLSMYGLFVIIDGFTNIDDFSEGQGTGAMLQSMATHYLFQSVVFFDLIGSILAVTAVMVVFALLQKSSEILPILAAGIPMTRLLRPVVYGMGVLTLGIVINQEVVLPRISHFLEAPRGQKATGDKSVEPVYDHQTQILITGRSLFVREQRMEQATFVLPIGEVAAELTNIRAKNARWFSKTPDREAGWLLEGAIPKFSDIHLTAGGVTHVLPTEKPDEIFIVTGVSFDQLYSRHSSYKYLSTLDLIRRIKNPSDIVSIKAQVMHLHTRLVRPLLNLACVFIAVPLIVRRESRSLITSFALCSVVLGAMLALLQLCAYLGQVNLLRADVAAWLPIIACGTVGAWVSGLMQT
jgi:lipopolysaccharide export system permease protein